jgi:hypothetical protein
MYIVSIIFDCDVKYGCKDIIFFTANTGLALPLVNIAIDTSFMPACANMFTVRH